MPRKNDHLADTKVGAVIVFKVVDRQRIQNWLDRAATAGIIERSMARQYDATNGAPVWFIP